MIERRDLAQIDDELHYEMCRDIAECLALNARAQAVAYAIADRLKSQGKAGGHPLFTERRYWRKYEELNSPMELTEDLVRMHLQHLASFGIVREIGMGVWEGTCPEDFGALKDMVQEKLALLQKRLGK
jgi:hypothetical protein